MNEVNLDGDIVYFNGPKTDKDYNGPNIHDIDLYDAIRRSILSMNEDKKEEKPVRKLPDNITIIKNSEVIEFTLNSVDPYDTGEKLFKRRKITLKYGVNVLVGPNGSGKSTILRFLREALNSNNYKFYNYDNISDGGSNSISKAGFHGDFKHMANMLCSSEGEGIMINLGKVAQDIGRLVNKSREDYPGDPIFILFDAVDSGLSVNNINILKDLFKTITKDCSDVVIVVSCNSYEMTRDFYCWDVVNGKKVSFKSYNDFYDFICRLDRGKL